MNKSAGQAVAENTKQSATALKRTLQTFKIDVEVEEVKVGPTFTRYSLKPAEGVRIAKIVSLKNNLELALAAHPIRIEAPIPGKSLIGIEVPNSKKTIVGIRSMIEDKQWKAETLPFVIGKTITGSSFVKSLSKMPHILIAGTTGSGKSILLHNLIISLLYKYSPEELRMMFIDTKRVELTQYKGLPHMLTNPITDPKKALKSLVWTVNEMERRYVLLEDKRARDIISYNSSSDEPLPYIVIVIDELADLMSNYPREIEGNIVRIAQKARAVGIHLVIATQRPSVNVITGVVKANIPVRAALQVASQIDSRTILDATGAENLVGKGDLLFSSTETKSPIRVQSAFISEEEIKEVVDKIIKDNGVAEGMIDFEVGSSANGITSDMEDQDEYLEEARQIVIESKKASTSLLQRKLKIGYSRAARLIDMLEEAGVVGPQVGSKAREVIIEE